MPTRFQVGILNRLSSICGFQIVLEEPERAAIAEEYYKQQEEE